jgi:DNA-directed RNA polymerase specialized sigma subunit
VTPEQDLLIEDNIKLPEWLVSKYRGHRIYDEALDEARLALVIAAHEYNQAKGCSFKTFASQKIKWRVADYLRSIDIMSRNGRREYKATGERPYIHKTKAKVTFTEKHQEWDAGALRKGCWMASVP